MGKEPEKVLNYSAFLPEEFKTTILYDGMESIAIGILGILYYLFFMITQTFEENGTILAIFGACMAIVVYLLFGLFVRKIRKRLWDENQAVKKYYESRFATKGRYGARLPWWLFIATLGYGVVLVKLLNLMESAQGGFVFLGTMWFCWFLIVRGIQFNELPMYILAGVLIGICIVFVFVLVPGRSKVTILLLLYGIPVLLFGVINFIQFYKKCLRVHNGN